MVTPEVFFEVHILFRMSNIEIIYALFDMYRLLVFGLKEVDRVHELENLLTKEERVLRAAFWLYLLGGMVCVGCKLAVNFRSFDSAILKME